MCVLLALPKINGIAQCNQNIFNLFMQIMPKAKLATERVLCLYEKTNTSEGHNNCTMRILCLHYS